MRSPDETNLDGSPLALVYFDEVAKRERLDGEGVVQLASQEELCGLTSLSMNYIWARKVRSDSHGAGGADFVARRARQ